MGHHRQLASYRIELPGQGQFMEENGLSHSGVDGLNVIRRMTRATMPDMSGHHNAKAQSSNK